MKVCGKKDVHLPECDDCQELEERVEAVEECCDDAHGEIDTLTTEKADKSYVDLGLDNVDHKIDDGIDAVNERIDDIITASEPSITTLWEGVLTNNGDSVHLSDDVNNYDFLDVYYKTSEYEDQGYYGYIRVPAVEYVNYTTTIGGTKRPASGEDLSQYLTMLSFVDDTANIMNIREWSWNGDSASDAVDDNQPFSGIIIYRIDGGKETGGNLEIADARIGVDGTVYPSLGDAIRGQIQDTRDMIPQLVKTVSGNPIVLDDAFGEVKKLDVELLPIQDLHGYDKPWSAGAGKNKLKPYADGTTQTQAGMTGTANADGSITFNGTTTGTFWGLGDSPTFTLKAGTYTLSQSEVITNLSTMLVRVVEGGTNIVIATVGTTLSNTFTTTEDYTVYFYNRINSGVTLSNKKMYFQLEQGSTATSYEPYSNICPITGHDSVTVGVTGKNIFNKSTITEGYLVGHGTGTLSANSSYGASDYIPLISGQTYTYSGTNTDTFNYWYATFYDANKQVSSEIPPSTKTFTVPNGVCYLRTTVVLTKLDTAQLELGSTVTDYEPYHGTTATVTLPHTVYGAGVGVTSGEGKEKIVKIVLDGTQTIQQANWRPTATSVGWIYPYSTFQNKTVPYNEVPSGLMSDCLPAQKYNDLWTGDVEGVGVYNINTYGLFVRVNDTSLNTEQAINAYLAEHPITVCYELADYTDLSTTPTDITLYNGDNVISSDGDMELTYVQDMAIVIRKIENQL